MAHKTTKEENYSGLTEEGLEQWTVAWDEFFDFISEHNGEKIDVTIDEADVEKAKSYFAEDAEGETRCEDFFEAIENLGIEEKSLVLRFPNGLNHFGENRYGYYENSFPDAIAKIYLPPTFWARWREMEDNKELFVVPSNYTYVTSEEEEGCDEMHQEMPKVHYNNEPGEEENCCKTYHTDVKHFPSGKYSITLAGKRKYNNEFDIFYGDDVAEIAQAIIDDENDAWAAGVYGPGAILYIKNYTTGQTWTLSGEYAEGDTTASLWIDDVMPCFTYDLCYFEPESFCVKENRGILYDIGGYIDEETDSEGEAETFENGFNWGDIKLTAYSVEGRLINIALDSVCEIDADSDIGSSSLVEIQILGESYDWDEVEDMANGDD